MSLVEAENYARRVGRAKLNQEQLTIANYERERQEAMDKSFAVSKMNYNRQQEMYWGQSFALDPEDPRYKRNVLPDPNETPAERERREWHQHESAETPYVSTLTTAVPCYWELHQKGRVDLSFA